jgi:hypothetical protein
VCPLSVLSNWQTQIEEHTAGNLKVGCCSMMYCVKQNTDNARARVCPLSVLSNWQTQIEEHTAGNLQVGCHNMSNSIRIVQGQECALLSVTSIDRRISKSIVLQIYT